MHGVCILGGTCSCDPGWSGNVSLTAFSRPRIFPRTVRDSCGYMRVMRVKRVIWVRVMRVIWVMRVMRARAQLRQVPCRAILTDTTSSHDVDWPRTRFP